TTARMPSARAATPPYNMGRGFQQWTMSAFTVHASRASCSAAPGFRPSLHTTVCSGTRAASSCPTRGLHSASSLQTTGAKRRRSSSETTAARLRVFPLSPRPSTMWRTVLGKPALIPAEEIDETPQVEALIGFTGAVQMPEALDVTEVEKVQLAGF